MQSIFLRYIFQASLNLVHRMLIMPYTETSSSWRRLKRLPRVIGGTATVNQLGWAALALNHCLKSHKKCNSSVDPTLPTRVLDLEPLKNSRYLRLYEPQGTTARYACLSHCWGQQTHITATRKENLSAHLERIQYSLLPKTFRDAIVVAQKLGLRYLWIDSLCIIQNSDSDWLKESASMSTIYQNSVLTIAATKSKDGSEGCFSKNPITYQDYCIKSPDQLSDIYIREKLTHWDTASKSDVPSSYPLLTRGWAYQERFLAPRVLHFCEKELVWECLEDCSCQCSSARFATQPKAEHFAALQTIRRLQKVAASSGEDIVTLKTEISEDSESDEGSEEETFRSLRRLARPTNATREENGPGNRESLSGPARRTRRQENGMEDSELLSGSARRTGREEDGPEDSESLSGPTRFDRRSLPSADLEVASRNYRRRRLPGDESEEDELEDSPQRNLRIHVSSDNREETETEAGPSRPSNALLSLPLLPLLDVERPLSNNRRSPPSSLTRQIQNRRVFPSRMRTKEAQIAHQYRDHPKHYSLKLAVKPLGLKWHDIVREYSHLNLTVKSDCLPAMGGLARQAQDCRMGPYYAGLWEDSFAEDMLWRVTSPGPRPSPQVYRAPTWSWASVNAGVDYPFDKRQSPSYAALDMRVDKVVCEPASGTDSFGQITNGYVEVFGDLIKASVIITYTSSDNPKPIYRIKLIGMDNPASSEQDQATVLFGITREVPLYVDYEPCFKSENGHKTFKVYCLQAFRYDSHTISLVLKRLRSRSKNRADWKYERIGIVEWSNGGFKSRYYQLTKLSKGTKEKILIR
jgi:hypothetical protein